MIEGSYSIYQKNPQICAEKGKIKPYAMHREALFAVLILGRLSSHVLGCGGGGGGGGGGWSRAMEGGLCYHVGPRTVRTYEAADQVRMLLRRRIRYVCIIRNDFFVEAQLDNFLTIFANGSKQRKFQAAVSYACNTVSQCEQQRGEQ